MIDQTEATKAFEDFIDKAKNDPKILGAVLFGSRAEGVAREYSDYDVMVVCSEEDLDYVKATYPKTEFVDPSPLTVSEFETYALPGTRRQRDRYRFVHGKLLIDKIGNLQDLIDIKSVLNNEEARTIAHNALGGYFNELHRSCKNIRNKDHIAALLNAQATVPRIISFVFAIEKRVQPFNDSLCWELEVNPLTKLPLSTGEFLSTIEKIGTTADLETQKMMLKIMKDLAQSEEYNERLDFWKDYYFG